MSWGLRLKQRARALGLTDADVARGLGLSQGRYSAYCNEGREPDLALLVRICGFLGTTPDVILGVTEVEPGREQLLADAIGYLRQLDDASLEKIRAALKAVVTEVEGGAATDPIRPKARVTTRKPD